MQSRPPLLRIDSGNLKANSMPINTDFWLRPKSELHTLRHNNAAQEADSEGVQSTIDYYAA